VKRETWLRLALILAGIAWIILALFVSGPAA
jgi:hypothetical protein